MNLQTTDSLEFHDRIMADNAATPAYTLTIRTTGTRFAHYSYTEAMEHADRLGVEATISNRHDRIWVRTAKGHWHRSHNYTGVEINVGTWRNYDAWKADSFRRYH